MFTVSTVRIFFSEEDIKIRYYRACALNLTTSHDEDQATETSQENNKFLQIQLQLQGTFSDPHWWDFLSGGAEKQDSDQGADAEVPDGRDSAVYHKVSD